MNKKKEKEEIYWVTLDQYVKRLIDEGKRSKDKEFEFLFFVYGKEKITRIAKAYLAKKRKVYEEGDQIKEEKKE